MPKRYGLLAMMMALLATACGGESAQETTTTGVSPTSTSGTPTTTGSEDTTTTTLGTTTIATTSEFDELDAALQTRVSNLCAWSTAVSIVDVGTSVGSDLASGQLVGEVTILDGQAGFYGPTLQEAMQGLESAYPEWTGNPDLIQTEALHAVTTEMAAACLAIGWTPGSGG